MRCIRESREEMDNSIKILPEVLTRQRVEVERVSVRESSPAKYARTIKITSSWDCKITSSEQPRMSEM